PYVMHDWTVTITAWNDVDGSKGWTRTISGTTTPCIPPVEEPEEPVEEPEEQVIPTEPEEPVVSTPVPVITPEAPIVLETVTPEVTAPVTVDSLPVTGGS